MKIRVGRHQCYFCQSHFSPYTVLFVVKLDSMDFLAGAHCCSTIKRGRAALPYRLLGRRRQETINWAWMGRELTLMKSPLVSSTPQRHDGKSQLQYLWDCSKSSNIAQSNARQNHKTGLLRWPVSFHGSRFTKMREDSGGSFSPILGPVVSALHSLSSLMSDLGCFC